MRFNLVSVLQTETKMGTYTTNYNLFMPTIGEQGWGELVNGNFTIIDSTMAGLNTRVGTLETETDAVEKRVTTLETGEFETINCTGYVTSNGFVGRLYVASEYTTEEGDAIFSTAPLQTVSTGGGTSATITVSDFVKNTNFPMKISPGVYIGNEDLIEGDYESIRSSFFPRIATFSVSTSSASGGVAGYVDGTQVCGWNINGYQNFSYTHNMQVGQTAYIVVNKSKGTITATITIPEINIYVKTK